MGLTRKEIVLIHVDASELPFAHEFFDDVVCMNSYNYFGRDETYLSEKPLPFVKKRRIDLHLDSQTEKKIVMTLCQKNCSLHRHWNSWTTFTAFRTGNGCWKKQKVLPHLKFLRWNP